MLIRALVLVLAAGLAGCGAGERATSGERGPTCPPGAEPPRGTTVTLFHETHTHGQLMGAADFDRYVGLRTRHASRHNGRVRDNNYNSRGK